MGAIKREPTPPGPVTYLLDRLHQIHLIAGQPSIREIAGKVGRGVISSSTIHNMFRGPRVPRWGFLELVVEALDGDVEEFRELWQAARLAENENAVGAEAPQLAVVAPVTATPAVGLPEPAAPERGRPGAGRGCLRGRLRSS